jgi:CheY-like chemotaxis protein
VNRSAESAAGAPPAPGSPLDDGAVTAASQAVCQAITDEPTEPTVMEPAAVPSADRVMAPPRPPSTVLIIDPDPVSRRFVEIALGRKPDLSMVIAADGAGAVEILGATRVHLILAETDFADMNGLQLLRRLIQETRLRSVPFVFLSADARASTKRAAFAAGADDFLVKPCDGEVLAARLRALIAREQRATAGRRARSYGLAGQFSELSFRDLIGILEHGQRSGTISVAGDQAMGSVYLEGGRVVHALFGNLTGPAALAELMALGEGQFEFTSGPCPIGREQRTITESAHARMAGTRHATAEYFVFRPEDDPPSEAVAAPQPAVRITTPALIPALIPDAGSAAQIEHAIKDGFALGDLMSFTDEDLARWTAATPARERFHVLLIADLPQGISAMLTLAGSPTEDWILRSLSPRTKAVGLSFFLRRERLFDVVLIDISEPGLLRESLRRVPSVVIVAPPAGDAQAVGVKARVEMADLIARLSPPAVLVLGDPILKKALRSPGAGAGHEAAIRCLPTALGEPGTDLRAVLGEGIRLCAGSVR